MLTGILSCARFLSSASSDCSVARARPLASSSMARAVGFELVSAGFEIGAGHAGAFAAHGVLERARVVVLERPRFADVDVHHADAAAGGAGDAHQAVGDALAIGGELDAAEAGGQSREADEIARRQAIEQRLRGAQDGPVRADAQAAFIDDEQQQAAGGRAFVRRVARTRAASPARRWSAPSR